MRRWRAILLGGILSAASVNVSAQPQEAGRTYRVGFLAMGSPAVTEPMLGHFRMAMSELGYVDELDAMFASIVRAKVDAAVFLADPMFFGQRNRIAELALRSHLPTGFARRENVDAGGLLAYGPSLSQQIRRAASFVDRILRGARPSDLPVEQPTRPEFVINLKTAKALGLNIPASISMRADEVIE
jgi:putative ABC transport system substrate-binding protein